MAGEKDSSVSRIFIDCSFVDFTRQPTGIPRVVLKYIDEGYRWAESSGYDVIPVVPSTNGIWLVRPVPGAHPPTHLLKLAERSLAFERTTEGAKQKQASPDSETPHRFEPGAGDILFSPAYWHDVDPGVYHDLKASGCAIVILVHDILPVSHKRFYNAPWRYHFAAAVLQALRYADGLFCVSETTRNALERFAADRGVPAPPTGVALNGFQPLVSAATATAMAQGRSPLHTRDATALKAFGGEAPLLMVGSIEPKKGHLPVVKCLESMWTCGYTRPLVVIGRPGWMEKEITDYMVNSPFLGSKLFWLNGLDDHDLAFALSKSHALVFSSIAEGFGLPMIEAAAMGKPVIVLETPIAREVLGSHGLYFDDAAALMRRITALEDEHAYLAACADIAGFEWPTWQTLVPELFDELVAGFACPAPVTVGERAATGGNDA